jgi:hypothetical protein
MSTRGHDGARLAAWRASLPGAKPGAQIPMRSLSTALGWGLTRWRDLEALPVWSEHQRAEVREGVRAIAARLDIPESAVDACVAFVLDGAPAPELGAWRAGECPAAQMGRPRGTGRPLRRGRMVLLPDDEPDPARPQAARPILPEQVRRHQVAAILRALAAGEIDEKTATEAIGDIYEPLRLYYNKTPGPDADVA